MIDILDTDTVNRNCTDFAGCWKNLAITLTQLRAQIKILMNICYEKSIFDSVLEK